MVEKFSVLIIFGWIMKVAIMKLPNLGLIFQFLLLCTLSPMLSLVLNLIFSGEGKLVIAILKKKLETLKLRLWRWKILGLILMGNGNKLGLEL